MEANQLFELALGMGAEWKVVKSEIDMEGKALKLSLDFQPGSQFACPQCGKLCGAYDTQEKQWRHMNFWQYNTELSARCPRVKCDEHGVLQAQMPWARSGSGFTLMMEAMIMLLCQQMPVVEVGANWEFTTRSFGVWSIITWSRRRRDGIGRR